jgi:hypothetical protein
MHGKTETLNGMRRIRGLRMGNLELFRLKISALCPVATASQF